MKNQNRISTAIFLTGLILLLLALANTAKRFPVEAQQPPDADEEVFGLVGITAGQTLRLNVVNTDDRQAVTRTLKFVDTDGNIIVNTSGQLVQSTVMLAPGESAFLDLNGSDIPGIGTGSRLVRGVDPTNCGRGCAGPNTVLQTLEMFDNPSSRTTLYYSPSQRLQPEGPPTRQSSFGMVGVAAGQMARLNVVVPPDPIIPDGPPIRVLLGFAKSDGQPVLNADGVPLVLDTMIQPGGSASFQLNASVFLAVGETRTEIRPLAVRPDGPTQRFISTLELIDAGSVKTSLLALPAATHPSCR